MRGGRRKARMRDEGEREREGGKEGQGKGSLLPAHSTMANHRTTMRADAG